MGCSVLNCIPYLYAFHDVKIDTLITCPCYVCGASILLKGQIFIGDKPEFCICFPCNSYPRLESIETSVTQSEVFNSACQHGLASAN